MLLRVLPVRLLVLAMTATGKPTPTQYVRVPDMVATAGIAASIIDADPCKGTTARPSKRMQR